MTTQQLQLQEKALTLKGIQNSICAGYIAGSVGLLVGHPLDSLKVLLQTSSISSTNHPNNNNHSSSSISSTINSSSISNNTNNAVSANNIHRRMHTSSSTCKSTVNGNGNAAIIISKRSLRSLYSGIGIPLFTVGLLQSTNFMLYDSIRRVLYYQSQRTTHCNVNVNTHTFTDTPNSYSYPSSYLYLYEDSLWNVCAASGLAGGMLSLVTSPLQVIKTFQQLMPQWNVPFILKNFNIKALYAGYGAHFACDTFGRMIYFGVYEGMKREFVCNNNKTNDMHASVTGTHGNIAMWQRMVSAAVAGMTCWTVIFPADVIRCRIYNRMLRSFGSSSSAATSAVSSLTSVTTSLEMAREIFSNNKQGFYRGCGFGLTVMRAGPVAAAVLPVYDVALEWLVSTESK